ncbi:helix-turn-helix transcriptional regulator [Miltoncostaea oceani]|uniref:helix-turn-helix transcriptional regulator n=1 Tax=Miltoncostaea oceani TaxID=2843216 RepID=UPI001C3E6AE8|nr:helix-turn-helix transcriptional regulator [Miltoncostaea oceani]
MNGSDLVFVARTRAGLSQAELGRRAGMAQNAVARIESARTHPSFETIRDLVRAAGFEPEIELRTRDESLRSDAGERLRMSTPERVSRGIRAAQVARRLVGVAARQER